ncbi:MAG: response regulator [Thermodesulfobacteriota bacterium]
MKTTTSPDDLAGFKDDRLVYIAKGNLAFVRLLTMFLVNSQGYRSVVVDKDELAAVVEKHRPDFLIIVDDIPLYDRLRSAVGARGVPFLLVTTSEMKPTPVPDLALGDQVWALKNDPADFLRVLRGLVPEPTAKRILCLDDSPTLLKHLKKTFAGTPYIIYTAEDGQAGLDMLPQVRPDLILVDIDMPIMDGLEFCRRVRSRDDLAEVPLIILSAKLDHETIVAGFEAGADEYLTKPFFPDELLNKIESYLVPPPARRQEHVLVVNDQPTVTHQLKLALASQGFEVTAAADPDQALAVAGREIPDLVISDADLKGLTGFQFCARMRDRTELQRIPFVLMTGQTSAGARKMGAKVGVTAYLTKPFTREGVVALVERILAERRSLRALEWQVVLASITSLAKALDERDAYTRFHSENVSRFAVAIGRKSGLNSAEIENLRLAGLLHDIGKIGIPDRVLHKPGKLTEEEFDQIKQHSRVGAEILKPIPGLDQVVSTILHHHERLDGRGYPAGLQSDDIPIPAQILAVADTFDALVTDRPYRQGLPREKAVAIMKEVSGSQLSPRFVKLFLEWLAESEWDDSVGQ